jgi:hypothetical protein
MYETSYNFSTTKYVSYQTLCQSNRWKLVLVGKVCVWCVGTGLDKAILAMNWKCWRGVMGKFIVLFYFSIDLNFSKVKELVKEPFIWFCFSGSCLFSSFSHFSTVLLKLFYWFARINLNIREISPLLMEQFLNIFSWTFRTIFTYFNLITLILWLLSFIS